jgi:hypothetical protein
MSDQTSEQQLIAPARAFANYLQQIDAGKFHATVSDLFSDLVRAMDDRHHPGQNKVKGEFKLTFKMELRDGVLEVKPRVEIKAPEDPMPRAIFWITPNGGLTVQNPAQMHLPLRSVGGQEPEVRSV